MSYNLLRRNRKKLAKHLGKVLSWLKKRDVGDIRPKIDKKIAKREIDEQLRNSK